MTQKQVLNFCKRHQLRAVEIKWHSSEYDWSMFRIEYVIKDRVALTGMTDSYYGKHDGGFFWCRVSDIKNIKPRRK